MVGIFVGVGLLTLVSLALLRVAVPPPNNLGVKNGRLAACPNSQNCVSSQDGRYSCWIAPLTYQDDPNAAWSRLRRIIDGMPSARVIEDTGSYIHFEDSSPFFGFVDDVEFSIEPSTSRIHVRSGSRIGYSDLGVNRRRVESIRSTFIAKD